VFILKFRGRKYNYLFNNKSGTLIFSNKDEVFFQYPAEVSNIEQIKNSFGNFFKGKIELFVSFLLITHFFRKSSTEEKHKKCNCSEEKANPRRSFV